jgi:hypothetical protein
MAGNSERDKVRARGSGRIGRVEESSERRGKVEGMGSTRRKRGRNAGAGEGGTMVAEDEVVGEGQR